MSPKAVDYFIQTAKMLHAENLVEQIKRDLDKSVFVEFREKGGWSRWLVLPDRRMVLFDFQGDSVLGWSLQEFDTQIRFDVKYWHMAKAMITPEGRIVSK